MKFYDLARKNIYVSRRNFVLEETRENLRDVRIKFNLN